jgi:hypothetical protein
MRIALSFLLLIAGTAAPAAMPLPEKVPVPGGETFRLRFGSVLSANDTCPVAKRPLNPRMRATWVNGKPIGFC